MSTRLVFVDVETTGLDFDRHEIWEIAVFRKGFGPWVWQRTPRLNNAEPKALEISGYYQRRTDIKTAEGIEITRVDDAQLAEWLASEFAGAVLAGIGPWFDAAFIETFLRKNGQAPAWDHRLIDVKALAMGRFWAELHDFTGTDEQLLAADALSDPPFETRDLIAALDLPRDNSHTALGDMLTAVKFYEYGADEVVRSS